jgi:hypothetical protein
MFSRSQGPRGLRHEMSSPAWTLGSWVRIPLEAKVFVCVYSVFVLSCASSGLATGWSLVQGALPTVYKCKITEPHKEEAKARYGLQRHIRNGRIKCLKFKSPMAAAFYYCWHIKSVVRSAVCKCSIGTSEFHICFYLEHVNQERLYWLQCL